jgi:aspartate kinase
MKVMKFGGGCIRDARSLGQVADIVAADRKDCVVVLSAVYGQTNEIREFAQKAKEGRADIDGFTKGLREEHETIARQAIEDKQALDAALADIHGKMLTLEILLYSVAYTQELTERTFDLVQSYGERLSLPLLVGAVQARGARAKGFESDKIGMLTDGVFGGATADLPVTRENLQKYVVPELKKGIVPAITGFFGCSSDGMTTTFGRNGSDYSAAVIASALDADLLEVWKDVDGFMSADPKIVGSARAVPKLSYDEAGEIAYFGTKILHPRTIEPIRPKNIPIAVRNTHAPGKVATMITAEGSGRWSEIKSVGHSTELALLKLYGAGFAYKPGVVLEISKELFKHNMGIYSVVSSQLYLSILLHSRDADKGAEILGNVRTSGIEKVELDKDVGLINVVGDGIGGIKGLPGAIFTTVANAGVGIKQISLSGTLNALNFLVAKGDIERTVNALHSRYVLKELGAEKLV